MRYHFILAALLLSACVSTGVKVDQSKLAEFKKGKTTYSEVIDKLGPPNQTMLNSDGSKTLIYAYLSYQARPENFIPVVGAFAGGGDMENTSVLLHFDNKDILHDFTSTQGSMGSGHGFEGISQPRTAEPRQVE